MINKDVEAMLTLAIEEARDRRHEYLCVEHVLYALLDDKYGASILVQCGANLDELRGQLETFFVNELEKVPENRELMVQQTKAFQRLTQQALAHVQNSGKGEVDSGDILAAMFEEDSHAAYFLNAAGVTRLDVLNYISHGATKTGSDTHAGEAAERDPRGDQSADPLELYTVSLKERAAAGKIDPLIGREAELRRAARVLSRRRKNNPVFVGEPGVGKTALVEGLALNIYEGKAPKVLLDAEILQLDLPALLAGTQFRGEFESRIKAVLKALEERENTILFLDEIHTVVGAGSTQGSTMDASSILKPALASGELRCIGATTYEEYKQTFTKDRGLSRRFQKIDVTEPTVEETVRILRGLKSRYEDHHGIPYTDTALRAAAELSAKHINDRFLPDKAIDVIDEAGAQVKLESATTRKSVRPLDIEKIVAEMARIPARTVSSSDKIRLETLEDELNQVVFGQEEAIKAIVTSIKRSRAGLGQPDKPVGSFLFTGPTGVGKTELAKQLAESLGVNFLRFDMSEYMEKHAVSRLIGAPPGYVGFDEGGQLTDEIRKNPYTVLLMDEIEKAHEEVFNVLLQVMDHATLTDNSGKKADFRNVVLIMTSNAGARDLAARSVGFSVGAEDKKQKGLKAIEKAFSPEFRNRLDAIVPFDGLPMEVVLRVVDKFIAQVQTKLAARKVVLTVSDEVREWLATKGYDDTLGARPLGRLIQTEIENRLSDELLFGALEKGGTARAELKDGALHFEFNA